MYMNPLQIEVPILLTKLYHLLLLSKKILTPKLYKPPIVLHDFSNPIPVCFKWAPTDLECIA